MKSQSQTHFSTRHCNADEISTPENSHSFESIITVIGDRPRMTPSFWRTHTHTRDARLVGLNSICKHSIWFRIAETFVGSHSKRIKKNAATGVRLSFLPLRAKLSTQPIRPSYLLFNLQMQIRSFVRVISYMLIQCQLEFDGILKVQSHKNVQMIWITNHFQSFAKKKCQLRNIAIGGSACSLSDGTTDGKKIRYKNAVLLGKATAPTLLPKIFHAKVNW